MKTSTVIRFLITSMVTVVWALLVDLPSTIEGMIMLLGNLSANIFGYEISVVTSAGALMVAYRFFQIRLLANEVPSRGKNLLDNLQQLWHSATVGNIFKFFLVDQTADLILSIAYMYFQTSYGESEAVKLAVSNGVSASAVRIITSAGFATLWAVVQIALSVDLIRTWGMLNREIKNRPPKKKRTALPQPSRQPVRQTSQQASQPQPAQPPSNLEQLLRNIKKP